MLNKLRVVFALLGLMVCGSAFAQTPYFDQCVEANPNATHYCKSKPDVIDPWKYYSFANENGVQFFGDDSSAVQAHLKMYIYDSPDFSAMCNISVNIGVYEDVTFEEYPNDTLPVWSKKPIRISFGWKDSDGGCTSQGLKYDHLLYRLRETRCVLPGEKQWFYDLGGYLCVYPLSVAPPAAACDSCSKTGNENTSFFGNFFGNPISAANLEKIERRQDIDDYGPSALNFQRYYSSLRALGDRFIYDSAQFASNPLKPMGYGWTHNYNTFLSVNKIFASSDDQPIFKQVRILMEDGDFIYFSESGRGLVSRDNNFKLQAIYAGDSSEKLLGWRLENLSNGVKYRFDALGYLLRKDFRNGHYHEYTYNGAYLALVRNSFGKKLRFSYSGGKLSTVQSETSKVTYGYNTNGLLEDVKNAENFSAKYLYGKVGNKYLLTGYVDENGRQTGFYTYDAEGNAIQTAGAGGIGRFKFNRPSPYDSFITVTDPLGTVRNLSFVKNQNAYFVSYSDKPSHHLGFQPLAAGSFDSNGLMVYSQDFLSNRSNLTWNPTRRLPLSVTEAAGTPEERTTSTEWHPQWRLPVKVTSPGRVTSYTYDSAGNALSQTLLDTTNNQSRTTRWTYNTQGLVASETAPNGAVTNYTYDAAGNLVQSTNALGHTSTYAYDGAGRTTSTTSPTGLVTAYTYDARGRVLTINRGGQVTTNTYTASGQLATAKLANGHQITYTYDAAQRLTGWSDNRGASATYQLDAMGNRVREEVRDAKGQHWLLARSINAINRVESTTAGGYLTTNYTYDANGDLVSATNGKNESTSATLDALRRTKAITNANSATASLTRNAQDDVTSATDYKGITTQYNRDTLGNATLEASKDSGNETAAFDALGLPSRTIDALGKATNITRDILGRPTKITHPASSTSAVTTAATTTTITYDQTGTTYNAPGQPNASKGSATTIVDASGTTTYQRDAFGRITSTTQKLKGLGDGAMHTTATSYTPAGQVNVITYPSGGKLAHTYNATGQLTALSWNGNPLLANITTNPLGQPTGWTWQYADANSATKTDTFRTYNSAGQLTQTNTAAYTYDAAGRITAINQNLLAPASTKANETSTTTLTIPWRVQYDSLGRITQFKTAGKTANVAATTTAPAISATYYQSSTDYQYDANGNRTAKATTATTTQGAWSQNQQTTISDTTNRLITIATTSQLGTQTPVSTTTSPSYNSAGDPSTDGLRNTTYNGQRRIDSIIKTGANQARTYYATNALGQRVFKTEPLFGTPTADAQKLGWAYVYDEDGTLLGEYGMGGSNSSGSTEHIYLPTPAGPLPVAAIINGQHYAVHADHLNTPRRITAANNQVVWQWAYSAFGETEPTTASKRFTSMATKPSTITTSTGNTGIQAVTYNLRYPGQVFDQESGLHYNYFRTYDPQTGRYTQPDPIGLEGGWNRFGYVDGNPLSFVDSTGLWASQMGAYVHQRAGFQVFGREITQEQLGIVARGHEWADSARHQTSDFTFMHAMRNQNQSVTQACLETNRFIKNFAREALALKSRGKMNEALFFFAIALHTIQDSTSPSHSGFQEWTGHETAGQIAKHIKSEVVNPNINSDLHKITRQAWNAFKNENLDNFKVDCTCK